MSDEDHLAQFGLPRLTGSAELVLVRVVSVTSAAARHSIGFAGVVESAGENVTAFLTGDAVFGVAEGAFAGYLCTAQDHIARLPDALTFERAAALALHAVANFARPDDGLIRPTPKAALELILQRFQAGEFDPDANYTP